VDRWVTERLSKAVEDEGKDAANGERVKPSGMEFSTVRRLFDRKSSKESKTRLHKESEGIHKSDMDADELDENEETREENEEHEEEPDFEVHVSDDEEDKGEGEEDISEENSNKSMLSKKRNLTKSGKEMKMLLRNAEKEENALGMARDSENEGELDSEDEEDEEAHLDDLDMYSTSTSNSNINSLASKVPPWYSSTTETISETMKTEEDSEMSSIATSGSGVGKRISTSSDIPSGKKAKLNHQESEVITTPSHFMASQPQGPVEEEEVRRALLAVDKIDSKTLVRRFRSRLTSNADMIRFQQIVSKLATVVNVNEHRYLKLKDQFRLNL